MPRQGTYPSAGADAEHGATAALGRLQKAAQPGGGSPQPGFEQAAGAALPAAPVQPGVGDHADMNDGLDPVLFGQSERPGEPITHGAPFGPGANFIPKPFEDDFTFKTRVVQELRAAPAPRGATVYLDFLADRIARGE